jgi:hypothetical protein
MSGEERTFSDEQEDIRVTQIDEAPEGEAQGQDGDARVDDAPSDAERLARLAQQIEAQKRPAMASERATEEKVFFPNDLGWLVLRPMTAAERREYDGMMMRFSTMMAPGESRAQARRVETTSDPQGGYLYLCGVGIQSYEIRLQNGHVLRGDYKPNRSQRRPMETDFGGLDPLLSDWVQLQIEVFNGLTDEQRREQGNL